MIWCGTNDFTAAQTKPQILYLILACSKANKLKQILTYPATV